jgi:TRAP-type mannitol/chloroaromatic compound transport system substrate-binding protein
MLARYDARNNQALQSLLQKGTQVRPYSEEILKAAEEAAFALYDEFAAKDVDFKAVYEEWKQFRDRIYAWHKLNEGSFTNFVYSQIK